MNNLPIYRAERIDSDEYVEGYYASAYNIHHYIIDHLGVDTKTNTVYSMSTDLYKIDPTTLAIHFPDMTDSQGNKIFASLSEDGKGGDICYVRDFLYGDLQGVARYKDNYFTVHRKGKAMGISLKCRDIKVIGIQK